MVDHYCKFNRLLKHSWGVWVWDEFKKVYSRRCQAVPCLAKEFADDLVPKNKVIHERAKENPVGKRVRG